MGGLAVTGPLLTVSLLFFSGFRFLLSTSPRLAAAELAKPFVAMRSRVTAPFSLFEHSPFVTFQWPSEPVMSTRSIRSHLPLSKLIVSGRKLRPDYPRLAIPHSCSLPPSLYHFTRYAVFHYPVSLTFPPLMGACPINPLQFGYLYFIQYSCYTCPIAHLY